MEQTTGTAAHIGKPLDDQSAENIEGKPLSLQSLACHVVTELLKRTGIPLTCGKPDQYATVEAQVRATVGSWDVGSIPARRLEHHIVSGIMLGAIGYAHTHVGTQVEIALYTVSGLCVDDYEVPRAALSEFARRLQTGRTQLHPVLDRFAETLARMPDFFNLYAATTVLTDSINFVNCTLFERELEDMRLSATAVQYPSYKRARNGLGEVFSAFIWDKFSFPDVATYIQALPDAIVFLIHCNDVLSFYKEELAGDTKNFIHDRARVTGKHAHIVALELLEEVIASVHRVRDILQGEKERDAWERFLTGYVSFHLTTPRYKLMDVYQLAG